MAKEQIVVELLDGKDHRVPRFLRRRLAGEQALACRANLVAQSAKGVEGLDDLEIAFAKNAEIVAVRIAINRIAPGRGDRAQQ